MSSGKTAEDKAWKPREQAEEARYVSNKEQEQLTAIRHEIQQDMDAKGTAHPQSAAEKERDFEGGFGGQEDLEDSCKYCKSHILSLLHYAALYFT
ncbi:hypothetical protein B0H21DRAFT_6796 [Amylocystis lapponica]|nr:hypothetical protein B0H21DRAFT_6796 [Amylocystis lapponica]